MLPYIWTLRESLPNSKRGGSPYLVAHVRYPSESQGEMEGKSRQQTMMLAVTTQVLVYHVVPGK